MVLSHQYGKFLVTARFQAGSLRPGFRKKGTGEAVTSLNLRGCEALGRYFMSHVWSSEAGASSELVSPGLSKSLRLTSKVQRSVVTGQQPPTGSSSLRWLKQQWLQRSSFCPYLLDRFKVIKTLSVPSQSFQMDAGL